MQATVALTQALAADLAAFLKVVYRSSQQEWFATVDDLGLSFSQLKALHLLDEEGDLAVGELGDALGLSLPAASRAADGLVQRGLAERRECASDRRSKRIALTDEGRAAFARLHEARQAGLVAYVESLSPAERDALAAALRPILDRQQT